MSPIMLTNIWEFCYSVLTSPYLRTEPHPSGGKSFRFEERENDGVNGNANTFSSVYIVRYIKIKFSLYIFLLNFFFTQFFFFLFHFFRKFFE